MRKQSPGPEKTGEQMHGGSWVGFAALVACVLAAGEVSGQEPGEVEAGEGATKVQGGKDGDGRGEAKTAEAKVGGRVHALWMATDEEGKPGNELLMNMVRLRIKYRASEMVEAALEADVAEALDGGADGAGSLLRDAYVRLEPHKLLRFQAGQFKKPFSRLELRSKGKLETIERGVTNEYVIEDLLYGERDIGVMLDGRIGSRKKGIGYYLGVFNGAGKNADEEDADGSKDFVARVVVEPNKRLSIGLNGSLKTFDPTDEIQKAETAWMSGADFRFKMGGFRLVGEGLYGENHEPCSIAGLPNKCRVDKVYLDPPMVWSALLLATYKVPICGGVPGLILEPVLKAEVLDPDSEVDGGRIYGVTPGVNLHIGEFTRLMIDGDLVFTDSDTHEDWTEAKRLMVQLAFDL